MTALDRAIQLADQGARDPVAAVANQKTLARVLRHLRAEHRSLPALAADKIVRVPSVRPIAKGREAGPYKIEWPGGVGVCRGLFAGVLEGGVENLDRLSARIAVNGEEELFTDGQAAAFVPLASFRPAPGEWFRLDRQVTAAERWTVSFLYEGEGGPPALTPFLLFAYARKDLST